IVELLDFPSLMALRASSRACMTLVHQILLRFFRQLLLPAAPNIEMFLYTMDDLRAYLGGYTALRFFTRIHQPRPHAIQIFVPLPGFTSLLLHLQNVQHATLIESTTFATERRGISGTARLRNPSCDILVFCSAGASALLPLVQAPSTALMCYVGTSHFGVLWPSLTFASRSLLTEISPGLARHTSVLKANGFDMKLYAWMWPSVSPPQVCARGSFLCPAQPRYLTDRGALHAAWEPTIDGDISDRICFRLDSRPCGGPCLRPHAHLPSKWERTAIFE
ncbi:hypothetical protein OH77DRAFT_1413280, partial [Trametes cingulata]